VSGFSGNIGTYYATATAGEDIRYGVHVFQNPTLIPFNLLAAGNSTSRAYPGDLKVLNGVQTMALTEGFREMTRLTPRFGTFHQLIFRPRRLHSWAETPHWPATMAKGRS